MTYHAYTEGEGQPVMDEAARYIRALWTRARREFGIHDTYELVFAVLNPESMRALTQPHSHVIPRREQQPLVIFRVDKELCEDRHADHLIHHVLPREMANVVCKIQPVLGDPHAQDAGWRKVFSRLGGVDN